MATTVKEAFREFASNLNITDRQTTVVANCRQNVVAKLGAKLSLHSDQPSLLIGSYDRDTLIRPLSDADVDVMVVLHYGKHKNWDSGDGAKQALDRFRDILVEAYPDTSCGIDRNCVTMKLSQFRLDVVPAFRNDAGHYTVPDTYRKAWLKTNPIAFADRVTKINKAMGGDFVPLIKMVKAWNARFNPRLRGFHIECMMINRYSTYTESYTMHSMVKVFFADLPSYLKSPSHDPVTGDQVDLYMDNGSLGFKRADLVSRAEKAAAKAEEAYNDSDKYPSVAIGEWRDLMGDFFPAYGS